MKYEEYIKLSRKRAQSRPINKNEDEALKTIAEVSRKLYMRLRDGDIRRLAVRSLKEILSTLPERPAERDINRVIYLIEGVILTVLSCIFKEGELTIVKRDKEE